MVAHSGVETETLPAASFLPTLRRKGTSPYHRHNPRQLIETPPGVRLPSFSLSTDEVKMKLVKLKNYFDLLIRNKITFYQETVGQ